uniref:Fe2OG dioxygenase domain-containing protein n=1 Tax=Alexandrium monilatum TaxID=311494 RepID=A0A7S4Q9W8_9DINO
MSVCTAQSIPGAPPGAITGEYPQVARYERGQHFGEHDDAFPFAHARRTNYQRRATLLVYLNSVAEGGRTSFPRLGLKVRPERGSALLFFPAFADGRPDPRMLHAAEPAVDEKWIAQIWVGSPLRES